MRVSMGFFSTIVFIATLIKLSAAQTDIYDSGGPLMAEQAAYDVTYYDLNLQVFPADSSINGHVVIVAKIVQPIDYFVVDLDTLLTISRIEEMDASGSIIHRDFKREIGKVWIALNRTRQAGEKITLRIY